jgi:hypothetical protein
MLAETERVSLIKQIKLTKGDAVTPLEKIAQDIAALEADGMTREEVAEAIDDDSIWIEVVLQEFGGNCHDCTVELASRLATYTKASPREW